MSVIMKPYWVECFFFFSPCTTWTGHPSLNPPANSMKASSMIMPGMRSEESVSTITEKPDAFISTMS